MRRLQCPYHAWCYGFDGSLKSAPHTEEIENFDRLHIGLTAGPHGGAPRPPVRRRLRRRRPARRSPRRPARSTSSTTASASSSAARAITYDVESNWKAIVENYSECLHCPGVHPELNRLSHYMSGDEYEGAGAWCGGSMTLTEGAETMALRTAATPTAPPIKGLSEKEQRDVLYFALFPNLLVSLHPDYVMVHTLWPRGAGRTEVVCEWYFEPETTARGRTSIRPTRSSFWDMVNRQDWEVCELVQRGIGSRGHVPGRYTENEIDRPRLRPARGRGVPREVTERSAASGSSTRRSNRIANDGIDAVRIARIAMDARVSTALVHYHFATREALLAEALEHCFETAGEVRDGEQRRSGHAPAGDDRPVPAAARRARARLGAVGRAVAARRPPPRAAPDRRASSTRA